MSENKLLILASDDDIKSLYKAILRSDHYHLTIHSHDDELSDMLSKDCSVIILHFESSMLQKITVLTRILAQHQMNQESPKILLVGSKGWLDHLPRELVALADDIMAFPFTPEALLQAVNKLNSKNERNAVLEIAPDNP